MMDKTEFDCEECQTTVCCDDDVYLNLYQEKNICTYCRNNKQYVPGYTGIDGLICSMKSNWFSVTNYDLLDEFLGEHLWCGEKTLHQDLVLLLSPFVHALITNLAIIRSDILPQSA